MTTIEEANRLISQVENWNCENITELKEWMDELYTVDNDLSHLVNMSNLPCAPEFKERTMAHSGSYPIWTCDKHGMCLVGASADSIESIGDIEEYYDREE